MIICNYTIIIGAVGFNYLFDELQILVNTEGE